MQHLDTDRLAALADEAPTDAETQHLASCVVCRRERDAFVALLALAQREGTAGLLAEVGAEPITSWDSLSTALRAEGLARPAAVALVSGRHDVGAAAASRDATVRPIRRLTSTAFWRRAAASVALLVGGGALGRLTAPQATGAPTAATPASQVAEASPAATDSAGAATASRGLSESIPVYGEPPVQLASRPTGDATQTGGFTGVPDALQVLARAQRDYQRAAAFLAEQDTGAVSGTPQILRARLAALDEVMPKVREALYEAPQDPVLNQYYLATADVRESTLRQLGRALPSGRQLTGY